MTLVDTLHAEIEADPAGLGYDLDDAHCAALLNARTRRGKVSARDVRQVLLLTGEYGAVALAAQKADAPDQVRALCINVVALLGDPSAVIDYAAAAEYAAVQATAAGLVAAELIAQATADAVLALGENLRTRAEEIGWGEVNVGDIEQARAV